MSDRPHLSAAAAITLDGKLRTRDRGGPTFPSPADKRHLLAERARADAILLGGSSVRSENPRLVVPPALARQRERAGEPPQPMVCIVSRLAELPARPRCFETPARRILFTTEAAKPRSLKRLEERGVEIHTHRGQEVSLRRVVTWLGGQGVRRLQCEGGGGLLFPLIRAGLVDELVLTLCPVVAGGAKVPSLADGDGLTNRRLKWFDLVEAKRLGDELFLRYRRKSSG